MISKENPDNVALRKIGLSKLEKEAFRNEG